MKKIILGLFILCYSYAIIRYHIGKNIPFIEWHYVLNKAFAWSGFLLIGITLFSLKWFSDRNLTRTSFGISGYLFCSTHILGNLILMNENRFPFLYESANELSWLGISSITLGIVSFCFFSIAFIGSLDVFGFSSRKKKNLLQFGKYGFLISVSHPLVMSYNRWNLSNWPLWLPPISLICVITGIALLLFRLKRKFP